MHNGQLLIPGCRRQVAICLTTVTALALIGSGCTAAVNVKEVRDVAIFTDSGFLTGDEAAVKGTLAVTTEGCVGIASWGDIIYPTVWPRGTTLLDASPLTIEIPGVGIKHLEDTLEGGGGFYGVDRFAALNEVATRCKWAGEVIGIRFD